MKKIIIFIFCLGFFLGIVLGFAFILPAAAQDAAPKGNEEWRRYHPYMSEEYKEYIAPKLQELHSQMFDIAARHQAFLSSNPHNPETLEDTEKYYVNYWLLSPQYAKKFMEEVKLNLRTGRTTYLSRVDSARFSRKFGQMIDMLNTGYSDYNLYGYLGNHICSYYQASKWVNGLLRDKELYGENPNALADSVNTISQWDIAADKKEMLIEDITRHYDKGEYLFLYPYEDDYFIQACIGRDQSMMHPAHKEFETLEQRADGQLSSIIDLDIRYYAGKLKDDPSFTRENLRKLSKDTLIKYNSVPWVGSDAYAEKIIPYIKREYIKKVDYPTSKDNDHLPSEDDEDAEQEPFRPLSGAEQEIRNLAFEKIDELFNPGKTAHALRFQLDESSCANLEGREQALKIKNSSGSYTVQDVKKLFSSGGRTPTEYEKLILEQTQRLTTFDFGDSLDNIYQYVLSACRVKYPLETK